MSSNQISPGGFAVLVVSDHDLAPVYRPGDQALYVPVDSVDPTLDGREAVVETRDGRRLLRTLRTEGKGRWTLVTPDGQEERGVRLHSAALVKWIKKGMGKGPTLH